MPNPQPRRPDHYFSPSPGAPSAPRRVELALPEGRLVTLQTDRGVFSPERVDDGTRALLAEGPPVVEGGTLVDVGCGYGPVAVALALRAGPGTTVWAVDVNERARDLCRRNAEANGVGDRVRVAAPEDVPADLVADQVWSNPPVRVGKAVLHELLTTWLGRLRRPGGEAILVAHRHLGADSLARWLGSQGWSVARLASRAGYRVLQVRPSAEGTAAGTATGGTEDTGIRSGSGGGTATGGTGTDGDAETSGGDGR